MTPTIRAIVAHINLAKALLPTIAHDEAMVAETNARIAKYERLLAKALNKA